MGDAIREEVAYEFDEEARHDCRDSPYNQGQSLQPSHHNLTAIP